MKQESVTSKVKSAYCFLFFFYNTNVTAALSPTVTIHAAQTQNQTKNDEKTTPKKQNKKTQNNNKKKSSYVLFSYLLKFI